jgi:hypothetical protein
VRLRVLLLACALAVLAFSGLRESDHDPSALARNTAAPTQLSDLPAPEPSLPAVVPDAATTAPTTQRPLLSAWHRHLRPADITTLANRPTPDATAGAARTPSFPLLI